MKVFNFYTSMLDFDGILILIISSKSLRNYHRKRGLSLFFVTDFPTQIQFKTFSFLSYFNVVGENKLNKIDITVATYSKFHDVRAQILFTLKESLILKKKWFRDIYRGRHRERPNFRYHRSALCKAKVKARSSYVSPITLVHDIRVHVFIRSVYLQSVIRHSILS